MGVPGAPNMAKMSSGRPNFVGFGPAQAAFIGKLVTASVGEGCTGMSRALLRRGGNRHNTVAAAPGPPSLRQRQPAARNFTRIHTPAASMAKPRA